LPRYKLLQLSCPPHLPTSEVVFGYFVAPDVVDTILGMEGTAHERLVVIFEEFEKKLIEETGLSGDRFISIDIGPIMGHPSL
jgi:hypothetical protein